MYWLLVKGKKKGKDEFYGNIGLLVWDAVYISKWPVSIIVKKFVCKKTNLSLISCWHFKF